MGTIDNVKSTAKLNRTQFFWKPRRKDKRNRTMEHVLKTAIQNETNFHIYFNVPTKKLSTLIWWFSCNRQPII